ncbi:hypothetical protein COCON_G00124110 [Conger conger]|uniref:Secreted protein n=1 Tax=Conger conger TaxID=82655 RepID=A0A9Q1DHC4_CONCO|nr:hypothetical protein COCON_G00124110 [Conger conger]
MGFLLPSALCLSPLSSSVVLAPPPHEPAVVWPDTHDCCCAGDPTEAATALGEKEREREREQSFLRVCTCVCSLHHCSVLERRIKSTAGKEERQRESDRQTERNG